MATKLRELRKKKRLSQGCVARELGVSQQLISQYEEFGIARIRNLGHIDKMVRLYNVSREEFLKAAKDARTELDPEVIGRYQELMHSRITDEEMMFVSALRQLDNDKKKRLMKDLLSGIYG